jgi:predicted Zn finger-like uncharacterized protein
MSLITRCPACQTSFRVVPDQLRISEGWVRCGQCDEVFDGTDNLQKESPLDGGGTLQPSLAVLAGEVDLDLHDLVPESAQPEPLLMTVEVDAEGQVPPPEPVELAVIDAQPQAPLPEPQPPISFLKKMPTASVWRRPWVRAVLGVVCVCLLGTLGLQVVVQERDRIASLLPQTAPHLVKLCAALNCDVSPLRQIESIVIDSSSFTKARGDSYRLTLVVKNLAPVGLALPSFELTLTDAQDRSVVRRVLGPADFGAASRLMAAGSEWSGELELAMRTNGSGEQFAGYRILAFYP